MLQVPVTAQTTGRRHPRVCYRYLSQRKQLDVAIHVYATGTCHSANNWTSPSTCMLQVPVTAQTTGRRHPRVCYRYLSQRKQLDVAIHVYATGTCHSANNWTSPSTCMLQVPVTAQTTGRRHPRVCYRYLSQRKQLDVAIHVYATRTCHSANNWARTLITTPLTFQGKLAHHMSDFVAAGGEPVHLFAVPSAVETDTLGHQPVVRHAGSPEGQVAGLHAAVAFPETGDHAGQGAVQSRPHRPARHRAKPVSLCRSQLYTA